MTVHLSGQAFDIGAFERQSNPTETVNITRLDASPTNALGVGDPITITATAANANRAITDPTNEPTNLPIIGLVVTVSQDDHVVISDISFAAASTPTVSTPITVTASAASTVKDNIYYRFYYRGNYGTSNYETSAWTVVQDYSTDNSCQFVFPTAGDYVVVVRAVTDPSNEPAELPIIGGVINVME